MAGAFQRTAFQDNAFQVAVAVGGAAGGGDRRVTYALRRPETVRRERLVIEMPAVATAFRAYAIAGRAEAGMQAVALRAQSAIRVEARSYAAEVMPVDDEEELELIALL